MNLKGKATVTRIDMMMMMFAQSDPETQNIQKAKNAYPKLFLINHIHEKQKSKRINSIYVIWIRSAV